MKTKFIILFLLIFVFFTKGQIITTNPAFITNDYTGPVEVIFDASLGAGGLKGFTGEVYAHTGLITSASTTDSDWKYAPSKWGDNSAKYKLTSLGNNKWKLMLSPSIKEYYGVTSNEVIKKIAFVFRSADTLKEGKDTGGKDIFLTVYEAGLNVAFTAPTQNQVTTAGGNVSFTMVASQAANLELLVNGTSVKSGASVSTLTHFHTFPSVNDYLVVAKASLGGATAYDTLRVCVPKNVETASRPSGVKDGINYHSNTSVTLVLFAPNKNRVNVIGDFSDWAQLNEYQMKRDGDYWHYTFNNLVPGKLYKYQYLVDNTLKVSDAYTELVLDPWNDSWIPNNIYPNMPQYPAKTDGLVATFQTAKQPYSWSVPNFTMHPQENLVIYELLLRDFTTEKSLQAAIDKLDYLKDLGVTAIELMPIQEFDGNNSWGYNPNHYFAPDKAYGTPEMYKKFIDECHKRGIGVILDVVFNHATGINPFASLYWNATTGKTATNNPWFNVNAPHPYSVYHDFNHEYNGTKEFFKRVLQYWITEYKIDGYRLDLTKGFTQKSSTESTASNYDQSRIDILSYYYDAAKAVKSDVMFILEHFTEYSEESALANKGIYLWRNQNNAFSQSAMGFQSESGFGGMNSIPRKWVGFAESHDEERNFYKAKMWGIGGIASDSIARIKRVPLNMAFATLIPGPKMIWQFGEMGYDYSIEFNERVGEKPSAFGWLNLPHRKQAYLNTSKIITLRKLFPTAFTQGNFELSINDGDWAEGRRIALIHSDLTMIVLGNFQPSGVVAANPNFTKTGTWYELLTDEELNVTNTNMKINVNGGDVKIYTDKRINILDNVEGTKAMDNETTIFPSITKDLVYVKTDKSIKKMEILDVHGVLLGINLSGVADLSMRAAGLYIVRIETEAGVSLHKVIKR